MPYHHANRVGDPIQSSIFRYSLATILTDAIYSVHHHQAETLDLDVLSTYASYKMWSFQGAFHALKPISWRPNHVHMSSRIELYLSMLFSLIFSVMNFIVKIHRFCLASTHENGSIISHRVFRPKNATFLYGVPMLKWTPSFHTLTFGCLLHS